MQKDPGSSGKKNKVEKTRDDWTLAALAALAEGGIDAVRVERLAARLGVSKGSFYWHFKDRADLLNALLDLWDNDFTQQLINNVALQPTPAQRLRALAVDALSTKMFNVDSARAESAVQAWAAIDPEAAKRLRKVETSRIEYLRIELEAHGLRASQAVTMAKVLYLALLGLYAARAYNPSLADDQAYLDLVELVLDVSQS